MTATNMTKNTATGTVQCRMRIVRVLIVLCLVIIAVLIGAGSYTILHNLQNESQKQQYYAIVRKIQSSTMSSITDKQDALTSGLTVALQYCPNESDWPECGIPFTFYQAILNPLHRITQTRSLSAGIIVQPSDAAKFETFAYQFYEQQGHPDIGLSPFGKGIFAVNKTTSQRYHDTSGTSGGGKYNLLIPVFQITELEANRGVVMYNTYSEPHRVLAVDDAIDCIYEDGLAPVDCASITGIVYLVQDGPTSTRPASMTLLPIVPHNSTKVVGVVVAVHNWDTVLNLAVNEHIDGIIAVVSDGHVYHSYYYHKGQVQHLTNRDVHDPKYDYQRVIFTATPFRGSTTYTIALYPTDEWMNLFIDDIPMISCLVIVGLVVLTSSVFYLYDFLVNRESIHKDLVMQTKRQYVRYISHEIRTPLNVVHLGFQVLYTEMKKIADMIDTAARDNPYVSSIVSQISEWIILVGDIVDSLNAAIAVLNDLIEYDKIDSDTLILQREPLAVWEFVSMSVKPFIVQARAKEITLSITVPSKTEGVADHDGDSLMLLADHVKLSQVFRNLVSNALKFTPVGGTIHVQGRWEKGDKPLEIETTPHRDGLYLINMNRHPSTRSFGLTAQSDSSSSESEDLCCKYNECGRFVITITDSGAGMSEKQVNKLFREGVQFNPNDLQAGQGSGLGLWITKGIVDAHHGQLIASSPGLGCGTTFTLILPAHLPVNPGDQVITPEPTPQTEVVEIETGCGGAVSATVAEGNHHHHHKHGVEKLEEDVQELHSIDLLLESEQSSRFHNVLITDDVALNRKMMCRSLQSIGYKCFQAEDGQQCLDIINKALRNEHESIDLILMDFEMPVMNGPTATATLREMGVTIPVIGVTGNVLNEDIQYFLECGALKVLQKPFSVSELERFLHHLQSHM